MDSIVLAGQSYPVAPLSLGRLKVAIPAFGRAGVALSKGDMGEQTLTDIALILSAGLNKTVDEIEQIPATVPELAAALAVIARVSGLSPAEPKPGEGSPAAAIAPLIGTISTAG
jgi:hypothetical protein